MTQLYEESKYRQVNLNTRINQIIKDHLDWHTNAPTAKMYYLPKSCITKVVDQLTELQISGLALDVARDFKDICLMLPRWIYHFVFFGRHNKMATDYRDA